MGVTSQKVCLHIVEIAIDDGLSDLINQSDDKSFVVNCGKRSGEHLFAAEQMAQICTRVMSAGVAVTFIVNRAKVTNIRLI